jgi:hypothetical protein
MLLVIFAGLAFGEGAYQRTKDDKITVWNDDPKPGDAADWFGDRDKEGYATGVGTLTWYTGDGALYARYHGNMIRGKFNGAVNAHAKGKTGHAIFIDGKRTGRWAAGRAPSRSERPAGVRVAAATGTDEQATSTVQRATTEARPTIPLPEKRAVEKQENPPSVAAKTSGAAGAQRSEPDGHSMANVQRSISKASASAAANRIPETPAARETKDTPAEGPPHSARQHTKSPEARTKPAADANRPTITIQDKPEVADFAGPPSALRANVGAEAPSAGLEPEIASSPSANAQLTPQEVMALADAEARAQGYELNEYQRPKADYSTVRGKWSLFYDLKQPDAASQNAQHFSVTVDDETKKAEVKQ